MKSYQKLIFVLALALSAASFGESLNSGSAPVADRERKAAMDLVWSQMQRMDKGGIVEMAQQALLKCSAYNPNTGCESRACSMAGQYGVCEQNRAAKSCDCKPTSRPVGSVPSEVRTSYY